MKKAFPFKTQPKYEVGQSFEKTGGDYYFSGVIVSVFAKKNGVVRYVGENAQGLLFIFNEDSIKPL